MVKITHLKDAFSEILELEASLIDGQSLMQKDKIKRKAREKIQNL